MHPISIGTEDSSLSLYQSAKRHRHSDLPAGGKRERTCVRGRNQIYVLLHFEGDIRTRIIICLIIYITDENLTTESDVCVGFQIDNANISSKLLNKTTPYVIYV